MNIKFKDLNNALYNCKTKYIYNVSGRNVTDWRVHQPRTLFKVQSNLHLVDENEEMAAMPIMLSALPVRILSDSDGRRFEILRSSLNFIMS